MAKKTSPSTADAILQWLIYKDEHRLVWYGDVNDPKPPIPYRAEFFDSAISDGVQEMFANLREDTVFLISFHRELDYVVERGWVNKRPDADTFKYSITVNGEQIIKYSSVEKERRGERSINNKNRRWILVIMITAIIGGTTTFMFTRLNSCTQSGSPAKLQLETKPKISLPDSTERNKSNLQSAH